MTSLADGSFHKWGEISTTFKLVLDSETAVDADFSGPLGVEFSFQIECASLVGCVSRCDEEAKDNPEDENVHSGERLVKE